MEYKALPDTLSKAITFGIFILFLAIGQKSVRAIMLAQGDSTTFLVHSGVLLLFISIVLGGWLFAPQSYFVSNSDLIIKRQIGSVKIKRSDMVEVRAIADPEMTGLIRTFGNGGLFGYYGKYYNSELGHLTLYATQRKNRMLIRTNLGRPLSSRPMMPASWKS